jgi:hypothetical protein
MAIQHSATALDADSLHGIANLGMPIRQVTRNACGKVSLGLHQEVSAGWALCGPLMLQATKPLSVAREQEKAKRVEDCSILQGASNGWWWLMVATTPLLSWKDGLFGQPRETQAGLKRICRFSTMREAGLMTRRSKEQRLLLKQFAAKSWTRHAIV